jgi:hypothetical protein
MQNPSKSIRSRARRAGFTMVELMVAVTGGMFVSMAVFMLAKQASGLYQSESRMSNATMGSVIGFERLRLDIERAGYLVSPNVRPGLATSVADGKLCGVPDANWPAFLKTMTAILIQKTPTAGIPVLANNGIAPDEITLAGSYASVDQYWTQSIVTSSGAVVVALQSASPAMARLGYQNLTGNSAGQAALLGSVFGTGRALRIVDPEGHEQYGTIASVAGGDPPTITLTNSPPLVFRPTSGNLRCGIMGNGTDHLVNVVNFVKYSLKDMSSVARYAPLYGGTAPGGRTELVREELDTDGNTVTDSEEIVSEYAVDLHFGLVVTQATVPSGGGSPIESLFSIPPDDPGILQWAGTAVQVGTTRGPQRIRGIRTRLSVRSVQPDRSVDLVGGGTEEFAAGLYRIGVDPAGGGPFARVRTMQADIAIRNQRGVNWL